MQSTNLEEIKVALWEQASHPCTQVRWGMAQVMAIRRRKGQLLALLRGRERWYPVEAVTIERPRLCPNWCMRPRRCDRMKISTLTGVFAYRLTATT